jgi:ABC-type phosphate/phosphonate transport system substrate-binding protein
MMRKLALVLLAAGAASVLPLLCSRAEEFGLASNPVQIGMIGSLFRDVPDGLLETMSKPFAALMSTQTGMAGHLTKVNTVNDLGKQLEEKKLHLGIFHGFEYSWVREKYPELKPLVIAVVQDKHLRAYLVVRADSELSDFGDLKDMTLNLPRGTRGHCHIFLERRCQDCSQCAPSELMGKITTGANAEEALDEVVDGAAEATIVDGVALDCYKRRKPARYEELKIAVESEVFPAAVVVYRPGTLDEKVINRFRDGLLNAHKSILGRQLLMLWKLTRFETIPDDYEQNLTEIIKAYPAPGETED